MPSADWSLPVLGSNYSSVLLPTLMQRDVDAITLCLTSPTNTPTGAIQYDRVNNLFQEWNGAAWVVKVIGLTGGGTGGNSAINARTSLGLGSLALQNANAVAITGGTITGVNLNANVITTGTLALARGGTGSSLALGSSGTFLQSNGAAVVFGVDGSQLVNLNGSQITSGIIPVARFPAGVSFLRQTIETISSTIYTVTSVAYSEILDIATSITPVTTASRIRIELYLALESLQGTSPNALPSIDVRIKRGVTVIRTWISALGPTNQATVAATATQQILALSFIDSPASIAAQTYHVEFELSNLPGGTPSAKTNNAATSSMTLSELTS